MENSRHRPQGQAPGNQAKFDDEYLRSLIRPRSQRATSIAPTYTAASSIGNGTVIGSAVYVDSVISRAYPDSEAMLRHIEKTEPEFAAWQQRQAARQAEESRRREEVSRGKQVAVSVVGHPQRTEEVREGQPPQERVPDLTGFGVWELENYIATIKDSRREAEDAAAEGARMAIDAEKTMQHADIEEARAHQFLVMAQLREGRLRECNAKLPHD